MQSGSNERWCSNIKPFATLTQQVTKRFRNRRDPSQLLRGLGIPFKRDEYWVEIQFDGVKTGFLNRKLGTYRLGVPTFADCTGNWAYRPDRDTIPKWNYARNLGDNSRGMPEVLHDLFDMSSSVVEDVIVWSEKTGSDWADKASLFVTGGAP